MRTEPCLRLMLEQMNVLNAPFGDIRWIDIHISTSSMIYVNGSEENREIKAIFIKEKLTCFLYLVNKTQKTKHLVCHIKKLEQFSKTK